MKRDADSMRSEPSAETQWEAVLGGDRSVFRELVEPHVGELLSAARRELKYHRALGNLDPDDPAPSELVGEVLARAWQDRHHRPPQTGLRVWLLSLVFRVAEDLVWRQAQHKKPDTVSIEEPVPPEPIYDDDESFWEWYQPDELTRWEDVVDAPDLTPEQVAAFDEEFVCGLGPRAREIYLLSELYGVPLPEAARAVGVSVEEAALMLADARRRLDLPGRVP